MRVVGTAGHVDHGKSTLVRALTGIDPDRFEEEKRRGLTIDIGFAWCTLPSGEEIGIVDVPGHERFIRNMLAGAGAIGAALFVVAADEGWMPQSSEHLQILDFLGVDSGVVALTKTDVAGDLADVAEEDVREHLMGTSLEGARVVRVSARTGEGLAELLAALDSVLGKPTAAQLPQDSPEQGRARLWIDRSFTMKGAGTVVTGTLAGGALKAGQSVTILPDGRRTRIRSMQTHEQTVEIATPPRRLALNLVGLDRHLVHRGDAVVADEWPLTNRFAARIHAARDLAHPLKERGAYELFVGSAQTIVRMRFLEESASPLAQLFIDRALPLIAGDRFVIRDVGRWETVAGGAVIDASPPRIRRGAPVVEELREVEGLSGAEIAQRRADKAAQERAGREQQVMAALRAFHERNPLLPGMPIGELRRDVIEALQADGKIVVEGNVVRLPAHDVGISGEQREVADRALKKLRAGGASPPELRDVDLSIELAKALEKSGELVLLNNEIGYPPDTWREVESRVVELITEHGEVTVAQIRDEIGTTRKYAVPLLEKLDATGVTRRKGDVRILGPRGR